MALSSACLVTSIISPRAGKGDPDCSKTKLTVRLHPRESKSESRMRTEMHKTRENEWMNECVFIYRTYHIVSQGGLQFYLSEIGRQLVKILPRVRSDGEFCFWVIWVSLPCTWTYYSRHQAPRAQRHLELCELCNFWSWRLRAAILVD